VRIAFRGFGYDRQMTTPDRSTRSQRGLPGVDAPDVVAADQPFDADGLYSLRATVTAHATQFGASPVLVDRLVIVASELASNAVRHGGGTGRLRLWRDDTTVYCQIIDRGRGFADLAVGIQPPGRMATGGRGVWICRQLCDDLIIVNTGQGATVTASMIMDPPGPHTAGFSQR
jgi:anti-sigma regulatory factor (Ser/Thr protein kinase)